MLRCEFYCAPCIWANSDFLEVSCKHFNGKRVLNKQDVTNSLANVRVILSHTSHPGNIGSAARAMKTMGLEHLYLINPVRFPDKQADIMAVSAVDVVKNAVVCSSLDEALAGTVLVADRKSVG